MQVLHASNRYIFYYFFVQLHVNGFDDKLPVLLQLVLHTLFTYELDAERFNVQRETVFS